MKLELLAALNQERRARRAAVLVTALADGAQRLVKAQDIAADPLAELLDKQLRMGKSGSVEHEGAAYFLTVQAPPAASSSSARCMSARRSPKWRAWSISM